MNVGTLNATRVRTRTHTAKSYRSSRSNRSKNAESLIQQGVESDHKQPIRRSKPVVLLRIEVYYGSTTALLRVYYGKIMQKKPCN